jgi:outer membrane protein OmpA-like peptidoglycan-associated protein
VTSLVEHIAEIRCRALAGELGDSGHDAALQALLAAPAASGTWIRGTFEGHYVLHGDPKEGAVAHAQGGVVTDLKRGEAPPPLQIEDVPWLSECIEDVQLSTGPGEALPTDLHDVRLYGVQVQHREESQLRIRAVLWARVVVGSDDHPVLAGAPDPVEKASEVQTDLDGLVVYGPDTRAVEGTGHGQGSGASLAFAAMGCLGTPLVVAVVVALGLLGGPLAPALWVGVIGAGWAGHRRLFDAPRGGGIGGCLGTLGVGALAVLTTGTTAWIIGRDVCADRPVWWLVIAALPVLASLGVRWRATLVLAIGAWSYGLWLLSAVPQAACAADPDGLAQRLPGLVAWQLTLDKLEEATAYDAQADLLADATQVGGDRRLSLDGALRHPEAWGCDVPVHLSGVVLFEDQSGEFRDLAQPHLRRLGQLLRANDQPIRLEGHGPEVGLSGVRAKAVMTWLDEYAGIAPERMTPLGLGDALPIVQDPDLVHYNRRIDVVRPCP